VDNEADSGKRTAGPAGKKQPAKRAPAPTVTTTKRTPAATATKRAATTKRAPAAPAATKRAPTSAAGRKDKPHGRDQVVESIIDATLSLWSSQGPAELSMRSIAARANVNYGLVHRHFGTKEAVIRAAMHRVVARSLDYIHDSGDLTEAIDSVLPLSTGAHARLIAWSILQYVIDDVMPEEDAFLSRMRELAAVDLDPSAPEADVEAGLRAGTLLAMLYGWRLFAPYLVRGLGLEGLSQQELNGAIRESMIKVLADSSKT
jgi:AcrR family transcriptional regulator